MVRKLLGVPLIFVLLTWIWNHAIAIGTTIINTFLIHEHWKHFQCFHRKICTVVINVFVLLVQPAPLPPPLLFIVDTILNAFFLFHIKHRSIYTHTESLMLRTRFFSQNTLVVLLSSQKHRIRIRVCVFKTKQNESIHYFIAWNPKVIIFSWNFYFLFIVHTFCFGLKILNPQQNFSVKIQLDVDGVSLN